MTTNGRVVVFGAGGHGKVVADLLLASGVLVAGFIDDGKPAGHTVLGLPLLGRWDWLLSRRDESWAVALGIGDNYHRAEKAALCLSSGFHLVTAIHPKAVVARSACVSEGAVVMAGAVVNADAKVGRGAIVNTGAVIEHDVVVGDFAHVSPKSALAGGASLGEYGHLGIGASVLPGRRIGSRTVVGAGAVVTRDMPEGVVSFGCPARVHRRLGGISSP